MESTLVTGANSGIGLEFVRQLSAAGWRVFAACRSPEDASELTSLAGRSERRITVHRLDVTDADQIAEMAGQLRGQPIDVLINNAGIYGPRDAGFGNARESDWIEALRVNTIAPLRMAEAFVDNVVAGKRKIIATITSKMGSIDDNTSGGHYIYRSTKSAVNMVTRSLSVDLRDRGITCLVLHPGWVRTRMGGDGAPLDVETSVRGMVAVLLEATPESTGSFFAHDGSIVPW